MKRMMNACTTTACFCMLFTGVLDVLAYADDPVLNDPETSVWHFADVPEGVAVLTRNDDFVKRLSPFDRSARLKTSRVVTEQQYLDFVASCVKPWNDSERQLLQPLLKEISELVQQRKITVPDRITLVKTNGSEEGQAPYTRGTAIVIPGQRLNTATDKLKSMLLHELFHILSRADDSLRDDLYALIGFQHCGEVKFSSELAARKLTNPDAPVIEHCIKVRVDQRDVWAMPILYASQEKYDEQRGGQFFDYLQFRLLVIQRDESTGRIIQADPEAEPELVHTVNAGGFSEQIGQNTGYIIHPDEILADNFSFWMLERTDLPSPKIIQQMQEIFARRAVARP
ncbi:hypothetical protein Pla52n_11230 [Stieleria varia]|uniref:DUF4157 domain-containing protein n=2 Tax=Stieleria varia TaxID=2528005 RepID=A0A5C6B9A1_9BACT|nr:hypothetical protein Pla52n_11230 [Stieleria varia]